MKHQTIDASLKIGVQISLGAILTVTASVLVTDLTKNAACGTAVLMLGCILGLVAIGKCKVVKP